jgi:outer membrane biosynthesis protein TonB
VTTLALSRPDDAPRRAFDENDWIGLGVSVALHIGLALAALVGLLEFVKDVPPPPKAIEIEIISDDVGRTSTIAEPAPLPPAPRVAPEQGPPEEAAPPEPAPPTPTPPAPRTPPAPSPRPAPAARPTPVVRPAPPAARPAPSRLAPATTDSRTPRRPGLDRSLVAGLRDSPGAPTRTPSPATTTSPSAPIGAAQLAGLAAAIRRQVQPCADRIVSPGPGAERITTKLNLQMRPDGSFAAAPRVISQATDADNARYGARVGELARAAFVQCAPFELPPALYDGWKNINLNYKLPE